MESYDLRIIKELNLFVDDVRHYYFDSKMIDESIKEAMNNSKNELIKQQHSWILVCNFWRIPQNIDNGIHY